MVGTAQRQSSRTHTAPNRGDGRRAWFIAAANCIRLPLRDGDILFVNDTAIMHSREALDEEGGASQRHLLKMLLHDPAQNWPVSDSARADWLKMHGPSHRYGSRREGWDIMFQTGSEGRSLDNG